MHKRIIIHVGLHKTATSFLQQEIFTSIKDVKIISCEGLSGNPCTFGAISRQRKAWFEVLYKLAPNAEILLTLREKGQWTYSCWKQYIKQMGIYDYETFMKAFDSGWLDFSGYVKMLESKFSKVHVVWYSTDMERYVSEICEKLDIHVPEYKNKIINESINDKDIGLCLFINRKFKRNFKSRLSGRYIVKWIDKIRKLIQKIKK